MNRHAVINKETGEVVNVIAWDGIAKWAPPEGHYTIPHEDCGRGDFWDEKRQDFMRPLKNLKSPEDKTSIEQRKAHYEEAKKNLKINAGFLVINDTGKAEGL